MDPHSAAQFVSTYGNVTQDWQRLLQEKPTEAKLLEAEAQCMLSVHAAITAIRKHWNMPVYIQPSISVQELDQAMNLSRTTQYSLYDAVTALIRLKRND